MKQVFPYVAAVFGGLVIAIAMIANQKKPKRPAKPKPAVVENQAESPAFKAGFTVGFMMAKTGQKKPSSEEIDAMARRQSLEAGPKGGSAYTYNWKSGFGMGWSSGD